MSRRLCACLILLVFGIVSSATGQSGADNASTKKLTSQRPIRSAVHPSCCADAVGASKFFGTWSGTWDGAGAGGGFDLILESSKDGAPGGRVSVTGEPTYKATLKTLSFDGQKMSATYDFPPDESMEIALAATFEGETAKGTWSVRGKSGGGEVATGGWTVKRK